MCKNHEEEGGRGEEKEEKEEEYKKSGVVAHACKADMRKLR